LNFSIFLVSLDPPAGGQVFWLRAPTGVFFFIKGKEHLLFVWPTT
jgi:hypothetical protein